MCALVVTLYEISVSRRVTEAAGSVVLAEVVTNDNISPIRVLHVRLDDGPTVRAGVDRFVTALPGERILLVQIETPLLGGRRYRHKRHLDPARSPGGFAPGVSPE